MTDQILVEGYHAIDLTRQKLLCEANSLLPEEAQALLGDADAILLSCSHACPIICQMLQGYLSMDAAVYWHRQGKEEEAKDYAERSRDNFEGFELRRPQLEHELTLLKAFAPAMVGGVEESKALAQDTIAQARGMMDGFIEEMNSKEYLSYSAR